MSMNASRSMRAPVLSVHGLALSGIGSRSSGPALDAIDGAAIDGAAAADGIPAADAPLDGVAEAAVSLPDGRALADDTGVGPILASVAVVAAHPATDKATASIQEP